MNPIALKIHSHVLGLEVGVTSINEVILWADRYLLENEYSDQVADISLLKADSEKEAHSMLLSLSDGYDDWCALRLIKAKLRQKLVEYPDFLEPLTKFLERIWSRNDYDSPEDFNFVIAIHDEYLLAAEGVFGTVREIRKRLLAGLEEINSPEGAAAPDC